MGTELRPVLNLDVGTLYAFLLVLTRVTGIFVFVPLPGIKSGPDMARVVLSLAVTMAMYPRWPAIDAVTTGPGLLIGWMLSEAALGIAVGVTVALLSEMFQMGAQIISLQAGYSFATTIDPTSGADSGVLLTIAQTAAGLLFFATGLDRQILLAFAQSLAVHPPGHFAVTDSMVHQVIQAGSAIFSVGLRLVLPLLALLVIVDISLALLARLNSQLQLITLAFPIKMLVSLALLAWLILIFPKLFTQLSIPILKLVHGLLLA